MLVGFDDEGGRADERLFSMETMMLCWGVRVLEQCNKIRISGSQPQ